MQQNNVQLDIPGALSDYASQSVSYLCLLLLGRHLNLASELGRISEEQLRERRRVAVSMSRVCLERECTHCGDVLCRERYVERRKIVGEVLSKQILVAYLRLGTNTYLDLGRSGNGDVVLALCEEPREGDLARRHAVLLAQRGESVCDLEDVREVGGVVPVDRA